MYRIENFEVEIKELNRKRMIRVYLPNDYDKNLNKHYKVMYMHDGHNLFYKETSAYGGIWDIQSAMNKSEANGNDGVIVVGIDCNSENIEGRLNEYSPWVNNNLKELTPGMGIYKAGGEGKLYGEFLVNSLKPSSSAIAFVPLIESSPLSSLFIIILATFPISPTLISVTI